MNVKSSLLEEEMEDMEDLVAVVAVVCKNNAAIIASIEQESEPKVDHRTLARSSRTKLRHAEALHCINRDYLGFLGDPRTPLAGIEFKDNFRISRTRFRLIMEDVRNRGIPFYQCNVAVAFFCWKYEIQIESREIESRMIAIEEDPEDQRYKEQRIALSSLFNDKQQHNR